MSTTKQEISDWLATLRDDALIGIDEGGLTLRELGGVAYLEVGGLPLGDPSEDEYPPPCTHPDGHRFECTGTAYGGDDERWHGEGRCLCVHCGADGDA